jgi:hypothetical protein
MCIRSTSICDRLAAGLGTFQNLAHFSQQEHIAETPMILGFQGDRNMLARKFAVAILSVAFMAGGAQAADIALAKNSMRLFGGPSMDYPRIGIITWGQGLQVLGCDESAKWCEVVADGQRGWVPSAKIEWPATPQSRMMQRTISPERVTI